MYMRRGLTFVFIICFAALICTTVRADPTYDAVMKPYKAYTEALKNKDVKSALKHAKTAWEQAEILLGDHKATGDLAYNYGYLAIGARKIEAAIKPLERSVDLAELAGEGAGLTRLERDVVLTSVLMALSKRDKANRRVNAALKFAEANNLNDTVFAGEIMVHKARLIAGRANSKAKFPNAASITNMNKKGKRSIVNRTQWRSAKYAQEALDIFEKHPGLAQRKFKAAAYKLIGFSHERDKEWLEATLAYQKAMALQKEYLQRGEQASITTIGRWTNTRMHLLAEIGEKEAIKKGLCFYCWPYTGLKGATKHIAHPIKRVPPKMPNRVTTSGFSFMKFDLDDAGKPINIRVIHSWPEKVYDKSSIVAIKKWRYTPRVPEETDAQRKDIQTTIRYILTDYNSGDPI